MDEEKLTKLLEMNQDLHERTHRTFVLMEKYLRQIDEALENLDSRLTKLEDE